MCGRAQYLKEFLEITSSNTALNQHSSNGKRSLTKTLLSLECQSNQVSMQLSLLHLEWYFKNTNVVSKVHIDTNSGDGRVWLIAAVTYAGRRGNYTRSRGPSYAIWTSSTRAPHEEQLLTRRGHRSARSRANIKRPDRVPPRSTHFQFLVNSSGGIRLRSKQNHLTTTKRKQFTLHKSTCLAFGIHRGV